MLDTHTIGWRARHMRVTRFMIAVWLVLLLVLPAASASTLPGRVLRVVDGDTIVVIGPGNAQYRVNLAGLDAPELNQRYGLASKEHLLRHVAGRFVVVDWQKRDRHGDLVGRVWVSGQDLGLKQVRAGLGWYLRSYRQAPSESAAYARAEQQAKEAKRGLWAEPRPIPPWEWRAGLHSVAPTTKPSETTTSGTVPDGSGGR